MTFGIGVGRSAPRALSSFKRRLACQAYNVHVMKWGEVELEPEVDEWFDSLNQEDQETAVFYVDLLAERGVLLDEPYTRQLRGKLRELRFHLSGEVGTHQLLDRAEQAHHPADGVPQAADARTKSNGRCGP
ncbi:type II toxin-antitoxin system RelE/ParE family toxin [Nonomuraea sp. NPDC059194]|uniref:type II toxin-antitoxin system RelE/ParE family toxin n=1 Tax=Nonomuraea sp. NPDC059194 TaxID=3346764 RepID=UPI00368B3F41